MTNRIQTTSTSASIQESTSPEKTTVDQQKIAATVSQPISALQEIAKQKEQIPFSPDKYELIANPIQAINACVVDAVRSQKQH